MSHSLENTIRKIALLVEYDGTAYKGFQYQKREDTVQAQLESAIMRLTGEQVRVKGAGRTDAGVHAWGQVVAFVTPSGHSTEVFVNALNSYLPQDIRVRAASDVSREFDPRRQAASRVYRYTVLNRQCQSALMRLYTYWVKEPLDMEAMTEAARHLVGEHDFRVFSGSLPPGKGYARRVDRWDVWREGDLVFMEAEANAFLPHQVRKTCRILVEVGRGRLPTDATKQALEGGLNLSSYAPLSPRGLCLVRVNYAESPFNGMEEHDYSEHLLSERVGVKATVASG